MADPLSQLRQFHINGREIKEVNGYIIFGDHGWPKNVNTNYQIYSTDDNKNKKEYYSLECLLYFLKNMDVAHHFYVKQAGRDYIPVVHRPDRKNLLAYLKGEQQTSSGIDRNAPIPPLRLPLAEIIKKTSEHHHSSSNSGTGVEPLASTSSQSSSHQSQHDNDKSLQGDGSHSLAKKRPHDPELEKKVREEFAARLYEPSNKKLATIIPNESEKIGDTIEGSAAISKFGAEKLAALRAKAKAVKRTTIIDADTEVGRVGTSAADPSNREAELLIAMDSDPSKLIKSKEKIWRTRSSILQAQSKNFVKTVLPFVLLLEKKDEKDPNRRSSSQMPQVPTDTQLSSQSQQQIQQQQQQQQQHQSIQRNTYNRYDQERFVKLDIGVDIDTKKSFVSGVTNTNYNNPSQNANNNSNNRTAPGLEMAQPTNGTPVSGRPAHHHDVVDNRHKPPSRPSKRQSTVPIIIIPATTTSLINMYNAAAILQDLTYVDKAQGKTRESEILIQRKKPDGTHAAYKILDNPLKLDAEDWNRVVAVFVQGPAWQFKGWPWGGSPVEIFSRIKGFHLKWDEAKLDDNVAKWNVHILELSRNKRHLDKANLLKFWSSLDTFMMKYKNFLKF